MTNILSAEVQRKSSHFSLRVKQKDEKAFSWLRGSKGDIKIMRHLQVGQYLKRISNIQAMIQFPTKQSSDNLDGIVIKYILQIKKFLTFSSTSWLRRI